MQACTLVNKIELNTKLQKTDGKSLILNMRLCIQDIFLQIVNKSWSHFGIIDVGRV